MIEHVGDALRATLRSAASAAGRSGANANGGPVQDARVFRGTVERCWLKEVEEMLAGELQLSEQSMRGRSPEAYVRHDPFSQGVRGAHTATDRCAADARVFARESSARASPCVANEAE
eukprot:6214831-Pleurochrysis_carterae.AAC.3